MKANISEIGFHTTARTADRSKTFDQYGRNDKIGDYNAGHPVGRDPVRLLSKRSPIV